MQKPTNDTHYLRMAVNTLKASPFQRWKIKKYGINRGTITTATLVFDVYEYKGKDYMFDVYGGISINV